MNKTKIKPIKRTRAQLERDNMELLAQLAHAYHFASKEIDKCSDKHLMASGVLMQLTGVGGKQLMLPVMIKGGLGENTINAIKNDSKRSYESAIMFKPQKRAQNEKAYRHFPIRRNRSYYSFF